MTKEIKLSSNLSLVSYLAAVVWGSFAWMLVLWKKLPDAYRLINSCLNTRQVWTLDLPKKYIPDIYKQYV